MAGVLNKSARPITIQQKLKSGKMIKHRLNPLDFKTIPDSDWNVLKKIKLVQKMLDNGDLVVGKKSEVVVNEDPNVPSGTEGNVNTAGMSDADRQALIDQQEEEEENKDKDK